MSDDDFKIWEKIKATCDVNISKNKNKYVQFYHKKNNTLDCHNLFINEAFEKFNDLIHHSVEQNLKFVFVITGKGKIKEEFPTWCKNHKKIKKIENVNDGSFKIFLKYK